MKISNSVLLGLKKMYRRGDYSKIEAISGMPAQQLARAVRTGRMSIKTYLVLSDYFTGEQDRINEANKGKEGITIYSLSHPSYPFLIYIGQTKRPLEARLGLHLVTPCSQKMRDWIEGLLEKGLIPIIESIETCDLHENINTEKRWIEQFRNWGFTLLNSDIALKNVSGATTKSYRKLKSESIDKRQKKVFAIKQYDLRGKLKVVHANIKDAVKATGYSEKSILRQLDGQIKKPHKCILKRAS